MEKYKKIVDLLQFLIPATYCIFTQKKLGLHAFP